MATSYVYTGALLSDENGKWIGAVGRDGKEYLLSDIPTAGSSSVPNGALILDGTPILLDSNMLVLT